MSDEGMMDEGGGGPMPDARATSAEPRPPRPATPTTARAVAMRVLIGAALLLVGVGLGLQVSRWWGADDRAALAEAGGRLAAVQAALSAAEERNWKYYRENRALQERLDADQGGDTVLPASPNPPDGPDGDETAAYGDGIYMVGEDIAPGTYDGIVVRRLGYWARLRNATGMVDGIIANAAPRGPFVLTVYESDLAVELQGVRISARR